MLVERIDLSLFEWFQSFRSPVIDDLSFTISYLGDAALLWLACAVIVFVLSKRHRVAAVEIVVALIISAGLTELLLKPLVARPRPFEVLDNLLTIGNPPTSWSFPSGHVAAAAAACVVLAVHFSRWRVVWIALPLVMGWSRITNGMHWPSDTLIGLAVGVIAGVVAHKGILRLKRMGKLARVATHDKTAR